MELYVGGCFQGKLDYVCEKKKMKKTDFADETVWGSCISEQQIVEKCCQYKGINHLHLLISVLLEMRIEPQSFFQQLFEKNPDLLFICDEVGYGIVPIKREDRVYRETVGRVLCMIASLAVHMERVVAGCGIVVK